MRIICLYSHYCKQFAFMRIAFLGKGGSGKTTLSAAFALYLSKKNERVLAVDADINVHMSKLLCPDGSNGIAIGGKFDEVASYVRGDRKDIGTIVATTPPSLESRFIRVQKDDPFFDRFATNLADYKLVTIGSYDHEDVGHTCYHGKLNTLELVYHHLLDTQDDYVIADATAGIDNLGTSLFFAYDLNVFVVEPTLKSIQVYKEFKEIADAEGLRTVVMVNKFEEGDLAFIERHIDTNDVVGYVKHSKYIKRLEQGDAEAFQNFIDEQGAVLAALKTLIDQTVQKDWPRYYERLREVHRKNSLEWWNDYYSEAIDKQGDPSFDYEHAIGQ